MWLNPLDLAPSCLDVAISDSNDSNPVDTYLP